MVYFDSAYLAKFYLSEPESDRVRALAAREGRVCCSALGRVETAQVFHRKLREGDVSKRQCNALFDQFELDCASNLWTWLALSDDLLNEAVTGYRTLSPKLALRSADAIHLVSAKAHGLETVYSNDRHLRDAAGAFGIRALSV